MAGRWNVLFGGGDVPQVTEDAKGQLLVLLAGAGAGGVWPDTLQAPSESQRPHSFFRSSTT